MKITMNEPLISVIVCAYNEETYIERCLKSIIEQDYNNIEIIVINDCSNDNTADICKRISSIEPRMHVVNKLHNEGLVCGRKNGIALAKGEYVCFVDGDDYIMPEHISSAYALISTNNSDFACMGYRIDDGINKWRACYPTAEEVDISSDDRKIAFLNERVFSYADDMRVGNSIWSKIFRRKFIKMCYNLVPDKQSYGEDLLCLLWAVFHGKKISIAAYDYYCYTVKRESMSHQKNKEFLYSEIALCNCMRTIFSGQNIKGCEYAIYKYVREKIGYVLEETEQYAWPNVEILKNKSIILYGYGKVGRCYLDFLKKNQVNILAIVDKKAETNCTNNEYLKNIDFILDKEFDYIVLAIKDCKLADEIKSHLCSMGVVQDKILWEEPIIWLGEHLDETVC